jgi:hypothetical protein
MVETFKAMSIHHFLIKEDEFSFNIIDGISEPMLLKSNDSNDG